MRILPFLKRAFLLLVVLSSLAVVANTAITTAQGLELAYPQLPGAQISQKPALPEFIRYLYVFSVLAAGFLAVGSAVYGGFKYLTSGGNPSARGEARAQITGGVLGSLVILAGYLLLSTINPQLTIFKLDKPLAQISPLDTCNCFNPVTDQCVKQCAKEGLAVSALEVPLGTLIADAFETRRINALREKGNKTVRLSKEVRDAALALQEEVEQCSCSRAQPVEGCSDSQSCSPATIQCGGQICDQAAIEKRKADLADAMEEFSDFMSKPDRSFVEFIQDGSRLLYANEFLQKIPDAVHYDQFLELKQAFSDKGTTTKVNPFTAIGKTVAARGNDPLTFYVDEEVNKSILESAYQRILGPPGGGGDGGGGGGGDGICSSIPVNFASGTPFNPEGASLEEIQNEVHSQLRNLLSEEDANIFFFEVIPHESGWNPGAQNFCSPHPPATGFYQYDMEGGVDSDPDTAPGSYPNGYPVAEPHWSEQTLNPVRHFQGVRGRQDFHGRVCSGWEYWQVLDPVYGDRWTCNPCEIGSSGPVPVCAGWVN